MAANTCPTCNGTGFELRHDDGGVTRAVRCACSYRDEGARRLHDARIPRRYEDRSFDNFEVHDSSHRSALEASRAWVERWPLGDGEGLLIAGPPGTGKTHLAVAILEALATRKNARVLFWEQRELLKALQGTFGGESRRSEADVLAPVHGADVLVLDDVGAGRITEWARDVLHEIIAHRYNHRLPVVMTTNCPVGDNDPEAASGDRLSLAARLGDALMSRLFEMCRIVRLTGFDYRKQVLNARIARH